MGSMWVQDGFLTVTAPRDQAAIKTKPRGALETAEKTGQVSFKTSEKTGHVSFKTAEKT